MIDPLLLLVALTWLLGLPFILGRGILIYFSLFSIEFSIP